MIVPLIRPAPPDRRVPPMTTAAMASSSYRLPTLLDATELRRLLKSTAAMPQQTRVGDRFDDPFAVLVTRPRVPAVKRPAGGADVGVRFIDDDRRAVFPRAQLARRGLRKRHVAVHRLFNEKQSGHEFPERRLA